MQQRALPQNNLQSPIIILPAQPDLNKRIIELDCIRGITALMVTLVHFSQGTIVSGPLTVFAGGTDLFFIVSGFVGYNLLLSGPSTQDFFKRRFIRLMPTFWVCASLTFFISLAYYLKKGMPVEELVLKYLYSLPLLSYYAGTSFLDGVYWTLFIEVLFYGVLGGILFMGWARHLEKGGAILLVLLFFTGLLSETKLGGFSLSILKSFPLLYFWPAFFGGIVFNRIKYDGNTFLRWGLVFLCLVTNVLLIGHTTVIHGGVMKIPLSVHAVMTVIYFTVFYLSVNNGLRVFVNKGTLFLAQISYCLYLTHLHLGNGYIKPKLNGLLPEIKMLILTSIMVFIAYILTRFVEYPLLHRMSVWMRVKRN